MEELRTANSDTLAYRSNSGGSTRTLAAAVHPRCLRHVSLSLVTICGTRCTKVDARTQEALFSDAHHVEG